MKKRIKLANKEQLNEIFPEGQGIRVQSTFIPPQTYQSKVFFNLKKKTFLAKKSANSLRKSLVRCAEALEKQIEKSKKNRKFFKKLSLSA